MTTHPHRRNALSRLAIAGAFLITGLAATGLTASAGPPLVDDGGSGGGGATATTDRPIFLEHFGLVATNDGPESFSMNPESDGTSLTESDIEWEMATETEQVPTLVGSGPEREFVYDGDEVPTLVGSGPEREFVYDGDSDQSAGLLDETARANDLIAISGGTTASSGQLDETARANDLIALNPTANVDTAIAHRGQPY